MSTHPSSHLRLTASDTETTVRIELRGDLDYDNADVLLEAVTDKLTGHPRLRDLHLGCAGLGSVDSTGLSVLLMIRRRTDAAHVALHLEERTPALERLLTITGSLGYLTGGASQAAREASGPGEPRADTEEAIPARPTGPDSSA
ncbi:STAS domain-containing protein [Streptomyces sp. NBC_00083]|uniref:STAS domain-containing protein n=1 Tax=Streptomyces sp. NBC_00083 TaxID=2975647 RepID=UPI0022578572|nr:STAS domain-containing protein [Streptomyces sp. NBC_00083]MCX5384476.1 STAS domain-containing protein [Streptomyces sp. NBC_00083]